MGDRGYRNSTLCYIERDGCYLMMHRIRKERDVNRDKWIGVGGGFEAGESPEDCVLRETMEETGLRLVSPKLRGIVTFVCPPNPEEYMFLFIASRFEGELVKTCDEGVLEWVPKDRVAELPVWEGDKIFLRLLAQDIPFFSLKLSYDGGTLVEAVLDGERIV